MLTGIIAKTGKQHWLQLVSDDQGTPDIQTICYADTHSEKFDNMDQHDVEVVEYETHTTDSLPVFLAKTKFAKGKSYDSDTHILCHLGKGATLNLPSEEELTKQMSTINATCPTMLVVATNPEGTRYKLLRLHPGVETMSEFNLKEELQKIGNSSDYRGVLHLIRGSRKPTEARPHEKNYPFQKLGYVPNIHGKYE